VGTGQAQASYGPARQASGKSRPERPDRCPGGQAAADREASGY